MEENYCASICYQGVQGGAVRLTDKFFLFRCQKLSIPDELKRVEIQYSDIKKILYKRKLLIFPIIVIELYEGKTYKFILFNIKKFVRTIKNKRVNISFEK